MRLKTVGLLIIILLFSYGLGFAAIFYDNFEDISYTGSNWTMLSGNWSVNPATDRAEGSSSDGNVAAAEALNGQEFNNSGLFIDTFFSPYGNHGQAFFSLYYDQNLGSYDGYAVSISNYFPVNGEYSFNIVTIYDHGPQNEIAWVTLGSGFDPTRDYRMTISVDDNFINTYLYDSSDTLIASLEDVGLILSGNSGMVGIGTDSAASFDTYSVTGSPVPIPASIFLMGSGLFGIVGFLPKNK